VRFRCVRGVVLASASSFSGESAASATVVGACDLPERITSAALGSSRRLWLFAVWPSRFGTRMSSSVTSVDLSVGSVGDATSSSSASTRRGMLPLRSAPSTRMYLRGILPRMTAGATLVVWRKLLGQTVAGVMDADACVRATQNPANVHKIWQYRELVGQASTTPPKQPAARGDLYFLTLT
jgi:hypothetical protein